MGHIVLLGDSVFDNGAYVPGGPAVIEQLQGVLPGGWRATLLAVDGAVTSDVGGQLDQLPADATHLVISTGGNDALGYGGILLERVSGVSAALDRLADIQAAFRRQYRQMLAQVLGHDKPTVVLTVYDSIPGFEPALLAALSIFNDVILREAFARGLPVIDLRLVCDQQSDYSTVSPIEPSAAGGEKIVRAVVGAVTGHDFASRRTAIFY